MFEKLKNVFSSKFEYVVDLKTFKEYLNKELQFTLENNLEACVDLHILYKGEKHSVNIWNFSASPSKKKQSKGLIVSFDEKEFYSIDDFLYNVKIANNKLIDFSDYFVIQLDDMNNEFLNEYKKNHSDLTVEKYK